MIANEVVVHEMMVQKVERTALAAALGMSEEVLTKVLQFELSEEEQLRLLWKIHEIAAAKSES